MSANYSTESLKLKLGKMNGTQESIQVTSYWFLFHSKHAKKSVETWAENLTSSLPSRKIFYLYLANDVLQQAKKKGNEFSIAFEKVLPSVFESTFKYVNPELKQKIKKVLSVWKERKVYGSEFIDLLEKKAQLNSIQASDSSRTITIEKEQEEEDARENDQSFSLPPILKDLSENMKALHENDASKVSAITRVNAIRSKLYQKEEFYSLHEKSQLEVIAGEISNALAHLGNFESMISTEMNTRENIKRGAIELLHMQDIQLQSLAAQHRDIMEKQELLKGVAQEIVSKISYGTGGIGGASLFALPSSVAGLNTAATNIHTSPVSGMKTGLGGGEGDHASMESAAKAAESIGSTTPYQHGVHPATLDRISFSLQQNQDEFEL